MDRSPGSSTFRLLTDLSAGTKLIQLLVCGFQFLRGPPQDLPEPKGPDVSEQKTVFVLLTTHR